MAALTRVYQYVHICPYGLNHVWRDAGTGDVIASLPTLKKAMEYRDFHKQDGNKWITPKERIAQQKGK